MCTAVDTVLCLPAPLLLQQLEEVARDTLHKALANTGKTIDDYRDPDRRKEFHREHGTAAVSASRANNLQKSGYCSAVTVLIKQGPTSHRRVGHSGSWQVAQLQHWGCHAQQLANGWVAGYSVLKCHKTLLTKLLQNQKKNIGQLRILCTYLFLSTAYP